jgi:transketolase
MENLNDEKIKELKLQATKIRISIIKMLTEAKSGHTAGPLDMADVFTLLYFHQLRHKPEDPFWTERDRVILSAGHICPVLYATMAHSGYFEVEELQTLRKFGTRLQGHPHREFLPMVESSSGPLGSGLSQAVGMAIADRMDNGVNSGKFFYCITGDGEHDEGNIWEAVLLAGKEKLGNLIVFVDRNHIQIDGNTEDILPLGDMVKKYEQFGWHAQEIDGHNLEEINDAINRAKAIGNQPSFIVARTIASKGVPQFEYDYRWHGNPPGLGPIDKVPKEKQTEVALEELQAYYDKVESE